MQRISAVLVAVLGVACLVFGVMFIMQASSGEQKIADEIKPLVINQVNAKYGEVAAQLGTLAAAEEPKIQAGTAAPSAMYNYLSIQRTSLGLARANIGLVQFVRTSGIASIIIGVGLVLAGAGSFRKTSQSMA
jgi:hypothetical protein